MKRSTLALLFTLLAVVVLQVRGFNPPREMSYRSQFAQERSTQQSRTEPKPHNAAIAAAHKAAHLIDIETITTGGHCSATAIGPHALLTASHCEAPTDDIAIDGEDYKVLGTVRDKFDHSILLVTATFTDWATVSTEPVQVGDDIFLFGNPGTFEDIFRKGYVAALPSNVGEPVLFDFNGWPGDSGSGIFNASGQLVDVTSIGALQPGKDGSTWPVFKLMGGWTLQFTPDQIKAAVAYTPPADKIRPPVGTGITDDNIGDLLKRYFRRH